MVQPRILALCSAIAGAVDRDDGVDLARILAPIVDEPDLGDAFAVVAHAFPHLAARPDVQAWPDDVGGRCLAVVAAELRHPRTDKSLTDTSAWPASWNWLVSLRDVLADREGPDPTQLKRCLERGELAQARRILEQTTPHGSVRAWQALLTACVLSAENSDEARERAETIVLESIERGETDVPPPVLAMLSVSRCRSGRPPPHALVQRLAELRPGASYDLALSAALTGWVEASMLSPRYGERLVVQAADKTVALRADVAAETWLGLARQMLRHGPDAGADLLGPVGDAEPPYPDTIERLQHLAAFASRHALPVLARMANAQLMRLRRRDLAIANVASQGALATTLMLANVLASIERPPELAERTERLLAKADAGRVGTPIVASRDVGQRISTERITVCVVNHNQAEATIRLLVSLGRTWPAFRGQVLLLDNGSAAGDFEALAAYAADLWPGRVRLLRSETNLGVGPARNRLFDAVSTDWILTLDNDMILIADLGVVLLPAVEASGASLFNLAYEEMDHPGLAGVGKSWAIGADDDGSPVFQTSFAAWATHATARRMVTSNRLSSGAALVRADVLRKAGGFSEAFVVGYEDYELSLRLIDMGERIETLSIPLMVHGHLAPARACDVTATANRFDDRVRAASARAFEETVRQRFGAHLGARAGASPRQRIVSRRLDFRHLGGPAFFSAVRPRAPTVAFVREGALQGIVPVLVGWLDGLGFNVTVRDYDEFAAADQALLVLQGCRLVVGGPSLLDISAERCERLGLVWPAPEEAPRLIALVPGRAAAAAPPLYAGGPTLAITGDGERLVAAVRACLA